MKRIEIRHTTHYRFGSAVRLGPHTLLLRPREGHDLRIASSALETRPEAILTWRRDLYDNVLGLASFGSERTAELAIESRVEVELYDTMPLNFVVEDYALHLPFSYEPEELRALAAYLDPAYPSDRRLKDWLKARRRAAKSTETFAVVDHLNRQIHADIGYVTREQEGVQPPGETLRLGKGSCRDMAALLLEFKPEKNQIV